jgi:hypothetical protein
LNKLTEEMALEIDNWRRNNFEISSRLKLVKTCSDMLVDVELYDHGSV